MRARARVCATARAHVCSSASRIKEKVTHPPSRTSSSRAFPSFRTASHPHPTPTHTRAHAHTLLQEAVQQDGKARELLLRDGKTVTFCVMRDALQDILLRRLPKGEVHAFAFCPFPSGEARTLERVH